jgi:hypothetical protein
MSASLDRRIAKLEVVGPNREFLSLVLWFLRERGRLRRGPQDVRRDIQVLLAPSVSRRLIPFAATVLRSLALLR